ncbi:hypothetical protein C8A01DRAFT_41528 [Parachaetomium inaequale]|uniref:Uncharacterized protein n=1 Tax=Parachaetomium inaequale TaxID=2588326 RepID=A0AAN6P5G8_9PEZI|nr:hypothetical protein C8A01DRAFT_41528 [Parachaetomium inaequale]
MKLAVSTLLFALGGLTAAMPAPAAEPDAASAPSALEARQGASWYAVRDVSRIALERLNGVAAATNNLNNEVAAFGGYPEGQGLQQAMNDVNLRMAQLYDRLGDIYEGAVSVVGPCMEDQ